MSIPAPPEEPGKTAETGYYYMIIQEFYTRQRTLMSSGKKLAICLLPPDVISIFPKTRENKDNETQMKDTNDVLAYLCSVRLMTGSFRQRKVTQTHGPDFLLLTALLFRGT